jgi:hypothetical protein
MEGVFLVSILLSKLRHAFALLFLTGTSIFAAWVVLGSWLPTTPVALTLVGLFFVCGPVGAFWMLYDCARHKKTPFRYFLFAFVPYAFVIYYFERVRPRTATAVTVGAANQHPKLDE